LFPENSMMERMLHHELARGWGWVWQMTDGSISGYILVRPDESAPRLVDITRLGVAPWAQRQRIGAALLERALEGQSDVILTVRKGNAPALTLYRKNGFEVVSQTAGESWIMRLRRAST
jgi:ribosomal protein S18 acetylase RimI-like enzyme